MIRTKLACLAIAVVLAGCASHWPAQDLTLQGAKAEFKIPPKQMVETIRKIVTDPPVAIGVQEENKGSILTGFQNFPGAWHVARRWQERTQYRIQIVPDFEEPTAKCTVEIRERTDTRAADGMKWTPATDVTRPERADELLKLIQQKVNAAH